MLTPIDFSGLHWIARYNSTVGKVLNVEEISMNGRKHLGEIEMKNLNEFSLEGRRLEVSVVFPTGDFYSHDRLTGETRVHEVTENRLQPKRLLFWRDVECRVSLSGEIILDSIKITHNIGWFVKENGYSRVMVVTPTGDIMWRKAEEDSFVHSPRDQEDI
jgi:hypothetical protein